MKKFTAQLKEVNSRLKKVDRAVIAAVVVSLFFMLWVAYLA